MTSRDPSTIRVDAVIPVYNEQHVLPRSVGTLHEYRDTHLRCAWRIRIADYACSDDTLAVAQELAARSPRVDVLHLDK